MAPDAPAASTRITPAELLRRKGGEPIVCLTAYTYPIARLLDAHVDLLLVGDSVAMVLHGHKTTLGATMDMMIAHGQAVMRGSARACVVVDMPAGSYEDTVENALASAQRIVRETGCDAVKLEGGVTIAAQIAAIVAAGIPVMGHIGLLPQSVEKEGGYKIKGRSDMLTIPTIGIGASPRCDGQILVIDDAIGLTVDRVPKFVKEYALLRDIVSDAAAAYAKDVRSGAFPGPEHLFTPAKDKA